MTEEQEQENFYRHSTVIVDVTKESLQQLIEYYLKNQGITYEDFIKKIQHDLYHLCYNYYPCCSCPSGTPQHSQGSRVIHPPQLDLFIDSAGVKLPCHNQTSKSAPNCCCPVKGNITIQELDVTLARVILINFLVHPLSVERKAIDDLVKIRNESAHAKKGKMAYEEYNQSIEQIKKSLLIIAKIYGKETETTQRLDDVCRQPFNIGIYLKLQIILLEQIEKHQRKDDELKQIKLILEKLTKVLDNIPGGVMSAQLRQSVRKRKKLPILAAASARKKADTMSVTAPQLPTVDTGTPFIPITSSTGTPFIPITSSTGTYPMLFSQTGAGIYTSASTGPVDLTSTANTLLYSRVPLPDQRVCNTVTSQDPPEHSLESVSIDNLLDGATAVPGSSLGNSTLSSIMPRNYHVVFGIEVENLTKYKLENSETYLTSGEILIPALDIRPGYTEAMVATKKPYWPLFGICGIVSWLISGCNRRLVIMFTLPWPAFLSKFKYTNKLSVGISDVGITDHDSKWHKVMKKQNNTYPGLNFKTEEYINSTRPVKIADETFQVSGIMGTGHQIEAKIVFKPKNVDNLAQNLKQAETKL